MNRWILGIAAMLGTVIAGAPSADAQVYYYGPPAAPVYVPGAYNPAPVYVEPAPVVVSSYYAPQYVVSSPVVQMGYSAPVLVPVRTVVAAPVVVGPTAVVRERIRPHHYTQTVRTDGFGAPRYSRVDVHRGLFGTTVRHRAR